jgi:hypothetical protein
VIAGKNKRAYAEAVRLIDETMRELYAESGRREDFDSYVPLIAVTPGLKPRTAQSLPRGASHSLLKRRSVLAVRRSKSAS